MGLIPLNADARIFNYAQTTSHNISEYDEDCAIKLKLHKKCSKKDPNAPSILNETHDEEKLFNNANILSGDITWESFGGQGEVKTLHDDILIAKLRPGQEIEMEMIATKGIGKTHAKWSPVCTAYYRFVPDIRIESPITGDAAHKLKKICPAIFDTKKVGNEGKYTNKLTTVVHAYVKDERAEDTSRECLRHEEFADKINYGKRKDIFEFHVESVGMYRPEEIVMQAIGVLREKAVKWLDILNEKESP